MPDQRHQALGRANELKQQRAQLWREVRGCKTAQEARGLLAVILEDQRNLPALASLRVEALLRWKPLSSLGAEWRGRMLDEAYCSEYVRVGELAVRQVDALAAALRLMPSTLRTRAARRKVAA